MERKRPEENQDGGSVEQVIDDLQSLYGTDVLLFGEVETIVLEMANLYGMDALFALEEWKNHYADNDIHNFRELAGIVGSICEAQDSLFVRRFCSLGTGAWQQLSFTQFRFVTTILLMKGDEEAFGIMKLLVQQQFDNQQTEYVVRFFFQFGLAATKSIFELFHARANEDYLDLLWRIMCKGEVNIGRRFMNVCVSNNLTTEQATHLFARLMRHLNEDEYDLEACKALLDEPGNFITLH